MITPADELRHLPGPETNFSESKWFSFYDSAQDFWASCRIGLEANRGKANRWVVVAFQGKIVYHDLAVNLELPASDWDDIEVGGLQIHTLATMSGYRLQFAGGPLRFEVVWEAATSVFDYKDCLAPLPPSLAAEHYEQSGTIGGTLEYDGNRFALNGHGHRDHSWGVRHWEGFRSWVAFMAPFGKNSFLHLEQFDEENTGLTRHGFLHHHGRNLPLKDAEVAMKFTEGRKFPSRFSIRVRDTLENAFAFTGEVRLTSPLSFGRCTVGESYGLYQGESGTTLGIVEYGFTTKAG